VSRLPEPRQVHAETVRLEGLRRGCIAVPVPSEISYGLRVPADGELRLGLALPEEATTPVVFQVLVQGHTLLEQTLAPAQAGTWHDVVLDLRPYAGASPASGALAQVVLAARPADQPLAIVAEDRMQPAAGPLPVGALWAAPQVTSERSWLLPYPLPEPPDHVIGAGLGGQEGAHDFELLGADVAWRLPGEGDHAHPAALVTLYWRALRPTQVPYTVFLHLLDAEGEIRGQWDSEPLGGAYPTDVWLPGSVIRDQYVVPLVGDLGEEYRMAAGLYDLATLDRVPVYDASGMRQADDGVLLDLASPGEQGGAP
jgi:hypothetical protein